MGSAKNESSSDEISSLYLTVDGLDTSTWALRSHVQRNTSLLCIMML
jgi:hypothetical protein